MAAAAGAGMGVRAGQAEAVLVEIRAHGGGQRSGDGLAHGVGDVAQVQAAEDQAGGVGGGEIERSGAERGVVAAVLLMPVAIALHGVAARRDGDVAFGPAGLIHVRAPLVGHRLAGWRVGGKADAG